MGGAILCFLNLLLMGVWYFGGNYFFDNEYEMA